MKYNYCITTANRVMSAFLLAALFIGAQLPVYADVNLSPAKYHLNTSLQQKFLREIDPAALSVLTFWFEEWETDKVDRGTGDFNDMWFPNGPEGVEGSADVDQDIREQFMGLFEQATQGRLNWDIENNPYENLAYILLIDQFSRNMFRGSDKAYAFDYLARAAVRTNIRKNFSNYYFTGFQRLFVVFPLMHHENMQSQQLSLDYLKALNEHPEHRYAFLRMMKSGMEHYQMILMFGRYPHRNASLHRKDTELEAAYRKKHESYGYIDGSKW